MLVKATGVVVVDTSNDGDVVFTTIILNTAVRKEKLRLQKTLVVSWVVQTLKRLNSNAADSNTDLVKSIQRMEGNGNNDVRLKVVLEDPNNAQEYLKNGQYYHTVRGVSYLQSTSLNLSVVSARILVGCLSVSVALNRRKCIQREKSLNV